MAAVESAPTLRHDMRSAPWIDALAADVAACDRSDWDRGTIQVIEHPRSQLLAAHGRIPEHVDADFPPWCYLLMLEAPGSTLVLRGHAPLVLLPGMLVEFDAHVRHRLLQGPRQDTVWCPIDTPDRMELDDAFAAMTRTYG